MASPYFLLSFLCALLGLCHPPPLLKCQFLIADWPSQLCTDGCSNPPRARSLHVLAWPRRASHRQSAVGCAPRFCARQAVTIAGSFPSCAERGLCPEQRQRVCSGRSRPRGVWLCRQSRSGSQGSGQEAQKWSCVTCKRSSLPAP